MALFRLGFAPDSRSALKDALLHGLREALMLEVRLGHSSRRRPADLRPRFRAG